MPTLAPRTKFQFLATLFALILGTFVLLRLGFLVQFDGFRGFHEGGIATPLIIGYLAQGGNFAPGLTYLATVAVIGALAYILMIGKLERVE